jgi:RNA polymerase sigma-70 factor (ECF subfamily)
MADLSVRSAPVKRCGASAENRSESLAKELPRAALADRLPEHGAIIRRVLERCGVPKQDAPDVAQDVFIAVLRHLSEYDECRPLRTWLCGFAVRIAADYRDQRQRRAKHVAPVDARMEHFEPADEAPSVERRLIAREELSGLVRMDPSLRAILLLHAMDGLSGPELAKVLRVPLDTAYTRLRRARLQLAHILRRERTKQCREE